MRYSKALVGRIVNAARCIKCAGAFPGAMSLVGERIVCRNCHAAAWEEGSAA